MNIFKTKYRVYQQVAYSAWEQYTPKVSWLVQKRLWWWPFWITMSYYKGEAFNAAVEAFERAKQTGSSRVWREG